MRKASAISAVIVLAVFCSQALAQEQVTLRLRLKPGQTVRFRGYMKGAGTVSMQMQPAPPQPMPSEITVQGAATVVGTAKAIRQDQWGNTRLRVSLDNLKMSADFMGKKFEMALEGGKMTMKSDGQVISGEQLPKLPGGQAIPLLQKPIEVKLGARGQLMDIVIPGFEKEMAEIRKMYGGVDPMNMWKQNQILLPENPITVGDTWTEHQEQPMPGGGQPAITDTTFRLEDIKLVNGKKTAVISMNSTSSLPNFDMGAAMQQIQQGVPQGAPPMPGMAGNMTMQSNLSGTALFDVAAGLMNRFDFRMDFGSQMNMNMAIPQQGQQGQAGGMAMAMNMVCRFTGAVARIQ